ncbi:MAG: Nif3-like dinuclear metal center hexameric protein [Acetivibrionales bacterium]|jgi:dinuclear metal center YbgI/SA1388 family protein
MSIVCGEIIDFFEGFAPLRLAEEWDNVGLIIGNRNEEVNRLMLCLDVTSDVVDEAVSKKINMIVSHHPFLFKGLKRISGDSAKTRIIYKLIKNDINVYCAHTNLDVAKGGINDCLAGILELTDVTSLNKYRGEKFYKLVVFVPEDSTDIVRNAISDAGAGHIGKYSDCTFSVKGIGTFRPLEGTNPYIGSKGNLEKVVEYRIETIVPCGILEKVIINMVKAHPYEEVAYDVYPLEMEDERYGLGNIGLLKESKSFDEFTKIVKQKLEIDTIRVIGSPPKKVRKVAVFCGSFDGNWASIMNNKADVLITGDIKYHTAMEALEMGLCILDAGHFATERIIIPRLDSMLKERFPTLEVIRNSAEKSPFKTI